MKTQPTVILHHVTPQGSHYDWLMAYPFDFATPAAGLWTARVDQPPELWQVGRRLPLVLLPDHRLRYLHYQGPISGNRGQVRRIAQGQYTPCLWTPRRRILDIQWQSPHVCMRVELLLAPSRACAILWARNDVSGIKNTCA